MRMETVANQDCCTQIINIQKFTSVGKEGGIRELCNREIEEYDDILNELHKKFEEKIGRIPEGSEIQVINKFTTSNDECVTPMGLVNVSLEYLAKLLTFANTSGYPWEVNMAVNNATHFKNLVNCYVKVKCTKQEFIDMAVGKGFRCASH